jgi:hypothetical protein
VALSVNEGRSFIGNFVNGAGFTFEDGNPDATSLQEMNALLLRNPASSAVIFPYIGGEEVLNDPEHKHRRHVINFAARSESESRLWPEVMSLIEAKVLPVRLKDKRDSYRKYWWHHAEKRPELWATTQGLSAVLFHPNLSVHLAFAFLPRSTVVGAPHNVFALSAKSSFCVLQSRVHEFWARFFGSSLEDRLRYTPSDCFEPFPFPAALYPLGSPPPSPQLDALEAIGKEYYEFRASLMADEAVRMQLMGGLPPEGLTKTYNHFHDPDCELPGIVTLRALHAQMDRAVLDAYGWQDIQPSCEFLLDYEEEEAEGEEAGGRRKKKPWRYRWPDEVRDEVLARLLELNRQMAERQ